MPSGGARPGAGRPPKKGDFDGTQKSPGRPKKLDENGLTFEERKLARKLQRAECFENEKTFAALIKSRAPELFEAAMDLAIGVEVEVQGLDGPRVYTRPPDAKMIIELLNRAFGKPPERLENSDPNGVGIVLVGTYRTNTTEEITDGNTENTGNTEPGNTEPGKPTW